MVVCVTMVPVLLLLLLHEACFQCATVVVVSAAAAAAVGPTTLAFHRSPPSQQRLLHRRSALSFTATYIQQRRWAAAQQRRPLQSSREAEEVGATATAATTTSQMQWELLQRHHVRPQSIYSDDDDVGGGKDEVTATTTTTITSWKGLWTTYDYMGDVILDTIAAVNYESNDNNSDVVGVSHTIVTSAVQSDCVTCFDSVETTTIPAVATYTPETLESRRVRLGACGMVIGPSLLKSGAMSTELIVSHGTGRVRVVFQHAPVWEKGVEPGSMPPQGLKLFRCLVARETCTGDSPPNAAMEAAARQQQQQQANEATEATFFRSVPPFDWHKKWGGTSWTWGPDAGHRGWSISELSIGDDDWHGSAPVEVWNLRLPGGLFVQTPRVIVGAAAAPCRLAWLPNADTLLRLEGTVLALQPILLEEDNDTLAGFAPPTLASLRCDVLQNLGDLEGVPSFVQHTQQEAAVDASVPAVPLAMGSTPTDKTVAPLLVPPSPENSNETDMQAIQDALQL